MTDETIGLLILLLFGGMLLMQMRWCQILVTWLIGMAFALGALASLLSAIASVIHFQILGAMGFLFLFFCCALGAVVFLMSWDDQLYYLNKLYCLNNSLDPVTGEKLPLKRIEEEK
jgi:hypothetical protein